ncbi:hypothetical protein [Algicella marina]|uniref:Sulfotransferase family protein n=1 Tax=Algicella marina TaxID=2683284 RepID=A0A6P1SXQ6_9RHOB|nr:hypothetical protein [Algicella marina]QHQ34261.1 hypothetical protein GO499_03165 [Algicella marina]
MIKIFGERNTGTRAVGAMLAGMPHVRRRVVERTVPEADGRVEAAILSEMRGSWRRLYLHALRDEAAALQSAADPWKHAAPVLTPEMRAAGVRTICMFRNPYSWFLSFARRPYHLKGPPARSLEAFVHRPWMTERREGLAAILASPMLLWSEKSRAAMRYRNEAVQAGCFCEFIHFEQFVQNRLALVEQALTDMHVPLSGLSDLSLNSKSGDPDPQALARWYRVEGWREDLTRPLVAGINAHVDWSVAEGLGYRRRDPADYPEQLAPDHAERIALEMSGLGANWDRRIDELGPLSA